MLPALAVVASQPAGKGNDTTIWLTKRLQLEIRNTDVETVNFDALNNYVASIEAYVYISTIASHSRDIPFSKFEKDTGFPHPYAPKVVEKRVW